MQTLADLKGKTVGAQIGTTGAFEIDKVKDANKITPKTYDEIGLAFEDLVNGRLAGVVVDTPTAANYALQNPNYKGKLKTVGAAFTQEFYGVAVKKGNEKVLNVINAGLKKVLDAGDNKAIEQKWLQSKDPRRETRIEVSDGALIPGKGEKSAFSAWRISFFGALALLVLLPLLHPDPYQKILLFLPDGILKTFEVTLLSIAFSVVVGLLTGIGRISRIRIINRIATIYVEIIRGIPLLVQIFYIYYALGKIVQVPDIMAAVIAMTVCYGAYLGEIFRAGIQSIHKGQMEAAIALGLTRGQALRRVILPQTVRVVLPPLGNEFIALLKDSSLVSILAVSDLLRRGREYASKTFYYFEALTVVALVYLVMTLFFSRLVALMEERMNRRGR